MKSFKQIILEAKKHQEYEQNIEGGDITKPYKTPADIAKLMRGYAAWDDTQEWGTKHTSEDQGTRRGAESIGKEEEALTPERKAEIEKSAEILKSLEGSGINLNPENERGKEEGALYTSSEIARILNAKGETTSRGTPFTRQVVDLIAQGALEKLRKNIK